MIKRVINSLFIFFTIIIIVATKWVNKNFYFSSFNQVLYTVIFSIGDASKDIIFDFIKTIIWGIIIFGILITTLLFFYKITKNNDTYITLRIRNKTFKFNLVNEKIIKVCKIIPSVVFIISILYCLGNFYVFDYIKDNLQYSKFFEEEYVNPKEVSVTFEKEKRNLIYIYLESMESTYADIESGGSYSKNYIPELTKIASENTNFSASKYLGGAYVTSGASWTMGAMIGHTSGVPYKMIFGDNGNEEYNNYTNFLPGAYSLGEILKNEGYRNYLMVGSNSNFGGRNLFFTQHGNYEIYDYYTAISDEIISEDYYVFWGLEDNILFDYAKEKLTEISSSDEPFNFTMLTVDTHSPDGYLSDFCAQDDENPYLNAISCSSKQISEFIKWIKKQDFYKNTTIILVGDHLSMNNYSFEEVDVYDRSVYNVFINSSLETECEKARDFNVFDLYPTTLAALGATIDGEKLGLGTNLYSCQKTLSEEYGYEYVNKELNKNSQYYIKCITKDNC